MHAAASTLARQPRRPAPEHVGLGERDGHLGDRRVGRKLLVDRPAEQLDEVAPVVGVHLLRRGGRPASSRCHLAREEDHARDIGGRGLHVLGI